MPSLDDAISATTGDPLDTAIDGVTQDKTRLRASLYGAVKQNPDEFARATQLSRSTGLPAPVVARNLPQVEQRTKLDAIDAAIDKNTALAVKMESQDFASLAHDDIDNLSDIERTMNRRSAGKIGGPAFVRQAELKASRGPEASFSSVISGLFKSLPQGSELARQGLRAQFADAIGSEEMAADAIKKGIRAQTDVALSTPEFESSTARGMYSGGSSLMRQIPGLALSLATRSTAPALATLGVQTEAEAYGKYRGRGATPGQAFLGGALEGGVEVATEKLPMGFLVNRMGKAGATEFLSGLLAREIPSEQIATLVQDAVDTAIANPDKTWGDYLKERPGAAYETLVATVTQGGAMGAINEVARRTAGPQAQADAATQDAEALAQMSALAAASKLRARDPQSFQEFVEAANEDGPVQDIYLDARTLQQSGVDLETLAQSSPTIAAQIEEAIATGGDLIIPMAEYAARIAGTDLDPVLTPHLRTAEDALSLDEAQRFYQGQAEEFKKAAAKVMEEKAADDAFTASAKAVEANLFEQLQGTGRFTDDVNTAYATLMRDFYVTTASRLGLTPEEMFARYPLQVRAESVAGEASRMEQGAPASLADVTAAWEAEGIEARLSERKGVIDLDRIVVPYGQRKKGAGTKAMQQLIAYADSTGQEITLRASNQLGGDKPRLVDFYRRFGFEPKNRTAPRESSRDTVMVRPAKQALKQEQNPLQRLAQSVAQALGLQQPAGEVARETSGDALDVSEFFQFAGENAANADQHALTAAQERLANGEDAETVRQETGWFKGVDGKWRYEISDKDAKLNELAWDGNAGEVNGFPMRKIFGSLGDRVVQLNPYAAKALGYSERKEAGLLDHPALFAAYPALADIQVEIRESEGYEYKENGYYNPGKNIIYLEVNPARGGDPLNALLHEIQHGIQQIEGFAKGGSIESAGTIKAQAKNEWEYWLNAYALKHETVEGLKLPLDEAMAALNDLDFGINEDHAAEAKRYSLDELKAKSDAAYAELQRTGDTPRETYLRHAGEVEARNTQARQNLNDEDRRSTPPSETADRTDDEIILVFNGKEMQSAPPPANAQPNRAEIAFAKDITSQPSVITLFKNADLSSFLHEMGHFQLEVLANIASRPDAPAEITADMDAVLKWFGVPDLATWKGMSLEERRPYHEQFARGFEQYLFEGKAPNQELTSLFARFRAWLVAVYKSVKALNVEISDDIRQVFDRLVATDEAIKEAQAARSYAPLFNSAEEIGDQELWADYQRTGAEATQDAIDGLQKRSLRDMRWLDNARGRILKEMQRDAKEKRKAVEAEVKAEIEAAPIYAAQRFLRKGELRSLTTDEVIQSEAHKLDTDAISEMYPEGMLARPDLAALRGMTKKGGLHPDLAAQLLSAAGYPFTSGDHLVREILAAESQAQLVEGMTDQRVLERYGDLSSPDTLARAVDEAIHNEARARFVATELKALSQATGPVRAITQAAKAFAEATLARKKVKDIKPRQSAAAETRAAKAADKALKAGDTALAAVEKRNQLVQNYSTRMSYDALTEVEKAVSYLRKFDSEGTRKGLDADYLDQIDQLLERFDLRASTPIKAGEKRARLLAWVESQREQGFDPDIPEDLLTEAQQKPYRDMTLEEFRGLVDTVKQIEHLGRLKKKLLTAQDDREFAAARDEIVTSIQDNAKRSLPEERDSDRGFLVSMQRLFRYALAIHRKFSSLARGFDGYKDGGPAWEYLVRNMNARGDFEASEVEKATVDLTRLLEPVMKRGKLTEKQFFPEVGKSFSREQRIGMLLNMGNETNLERQLTGERLAPAQLQQIVGTLSKEDAEFANQVWAFLDTYWPQVAEKQRRLTGKTPEKVEAMPFTLTLAGGEQIAMRGGYYPIAYDQLRSERSSADAHAEVARQMQQGLYANAQTRRGHTKARAESTGRPLSYAFGDVISAHVTQVIHDLAWHEYLIDANRLLRSPQIEAAVREHYGIEVLKEMKDALTDIAVGSAETDKGAAFWNHLRYGTTIAGLAFNVFNSLQNLTGITQSMSRIGVKWVLRGASHWMGDAVRFEGSVSQIHEKSELMRLRAKTMQREINDIRNKVSGKDSRLQAAYFYLQTKTQMLVDVPTWWGAYEKAMAEDGMTENKAVALADQAVLDAQGGGQTKDLAGIQRGGAGMKLFTTFYSFFNTTFNLTAEAYGRTDFTKPKDMALFAADMALLYSIPALLSTLLKAALTGDDDEDKLAKKIIGDQISFMLGTVVGLREMAGAAKAVAGVDEGMGYSGPASVRFFADLYKLGQQAHQGEADEAFWKALDNTGGVLFHYPAGQINRTASGLNALLEGRTENPMALVMGAPKH